MNNRSNALGLGTLVLGALIALGNFGYTMVSTGQINMTPPVASSAPVVVDNSVAVQTTTNSRDGSGHNHSENHQTSDRRGREGGRD